MKQREKFLTEAEAGWRGHKREIGDIDDGKYALVKAGVLEHCMIDSGLDSFLTVPHAIQFKN